MKAITWVVLAGALLATGCSSEPQTCVDWIDVSDPQRAYDAADAVVVGSVEATGDTQRMYGVDAAVHALSVTEILKGDLAPGTLEVASTPVTCTAGGIYPEGDPLEVTGDVIVFLRAPDEVKAWTLITPYDTVLPLPGDGSLPF